MTDSYKTRDIYTHDIYDRSSGPVVVGNLTRSADLRHATGRRKSLPHEQRFERVITAMGRRLDQPMTNSKMADIACLSPSHFNRLFRSVTGIPPIQFHYALRLDCAKRLLITTDLSITDICFEVGYNSLGTFASRFSQLVGLSPSAFRSFTRKFASMRLIDFCASLVNAGGVSGSAGNIYGTVSEITDGLIFAAVFPRAIPEGFPRACGLIGDLGEYRLPSPGNGSWHIFAVAVPWVADGMQLITLDGLRRGRSGPIRVEGNNWSGASEIELGSARSLDPPILTAFPVLLTRMLTNRAAREAP
jgi:AraC family transcriptional regulator